MKFVVTAMVLVYEFVLYYKQSEMLAVGFMAIFVVLVVSFSPGSLQLS